MCVCVRAQYSSTSPVQPGWTEQSICAMETSRVPTDLCADNPSDDQITALFVCCQTVYGQKVKTEGTQTRSSQLWTHDKQKRATASRDAIDLVLPATRTVSHIGRGGAWKSLELGQWLFVRAASPLFVAKETSRSVMEYKIKQVVNKTLDFFNVWWPFFFFFAWCS